MRLIKMFGLASIMAVTAIAIVGASSASASGVLCEKNEKVCPEESIVNHWIWNTPGVWRWRNTLLCLNQITLWAYDPWTGLYASYLTYSNCGTTIAHNNCSVRLAGEEEEQEIELTVTSKNEGTVEVLSGETEAECKVFGLPVLKCTYDEEGSKYKIKGAEGESDGVVTLKGAKYTKLKGSICPEYEEIEEGSMEAEGAVYVTE
jgi:hypothetical protein